MQSIMLRSFIAVLLCLIYSTAFSEETGKNDEKRIKIRMRGRKREKKRKE